MAPWFPRWAAPINRFPDHHGPYSVGTVDVEIPVADLPSPAAAPEGAQPTVAFRVFYPCVTPTKAERQRPVQWIQQPQKESFRAFLEFVGAKPKMSSVLATMLPHVYWININAHRNGTLEEPWSEEGRWPVVMFSHGLAASRNTYSYICSDIASYGAVVIAPDHRDGSSPVQFVRATKNSEERVVRMQRYPHQPRKETWEGRDKMLRVRLWEIATIYEALLKIDQGEDVDNLDPNTSWDRKVRNEVLGQFAGKLDLHRPGKVTWAGHSFGAATTVQLLKSIFYAPQRPSSVDKALIIPEVKAKICEQITPESPTVLLDLWSLPILSPDQAWLKDLALPAYGTAARDGSNVLSVLSEAFVNWRTNTDAIRHVIAPPSGKRPAFLEVAGSKDYLPRHARLRPVSPVDSGYASSNVSLPPSGAQSPSGHSRASSRELGRLQNQYHQQQEQQDRKGPHNFFPERSQHFSQSDCGVLFPYMAWKATKTEEPENILMLNVRAITQVMREAGLELAGEWDEDILCTEPGTIRRWHAIPLTAPSEGDAEAEGEEAKADDHKLDEVRRKLEQQAPEAEPPNDVAVKATKGT